MGFYLSNWCRPPGRPPRAEGIRTPWSIQQDYSSEGRGQSVCSVMMDPVAVTPRPTVQCTKTDHRKQHGASPPGVDRGSREGVCEGGFCQQDGHVLERCGQSYAPAWWIGHPSSAEGLGAKKAQKRRPERMKQSVMGAQGGGGGCGAQGEVGAGGARGQVGAGVCQGRRAARPQGGTPPKQRMAAGRHPGPRSPKSGAAHSAFSPGVRGRTLRVSMAAGRCRPAHNAMAGGAPAESPLPRSHGGAWWGQPGCDLSSKFSGSGPRVPETLSAPEWPGGCTRPWPWSAPSEVPP